MADSTAERPPLLQIRASAGSGKTHALTENFLSLLAGARSETASGCHAARPGVHAWPEIMAITFTNFAASEMKERVLGRLKNIALKAIPPENGWDAARAGRAVSALLRDFGSLNIRTIDSLLHLLVRLAALDLNLAPDFESCFDDNELFAPLLDDLAERAREGDPELTGVFTEACRQIARDPRYTGFLAGNLVRGRIAELASYFLLHQGDPRLNRLASSGEIAAHLAALRADLRARARALQKALDRAGLDVRQDLRKVLTKCADCEDRELPVESAMLSKSCLDECLKKASWGMAPPACEDLYARVREAAARLREDGEVLQSALGYMPFVRLARRLLNELESFQRSARMAAASRMPALAGLILNADYGVNEAFCRMGSRLTHILVDEFQDTSEGQWKALKPLVMEALARGGSLTIAGDVKQAIYGWRGGEAALFDSVPRDSDLRRIVPHPGIESLPCNRRSLNAVVEWNNAVFSQLADAKRAREILSLMLPAETGTALMDEAVKLLCATFADASQTTLPEKSGGMVRLSMLPGDDPAAAAALLPERVAELGKRRSWGSICVLTRSNQQTSEAASLLLERGIPVVTQGSLLLAEQPLIIQLVALLAFLNAPEDDTAFWSVLAGTDLLPDPSTLSAPGAAAPAALDAAELNDWAARTAGRSCSLAQAFQADFPLHWELLFAPLHDAAGLLTPYDTVCEIFRRWQVPARHPQAEGFLLRFLEMLHGAEQRGLCDLAGFLDYWKEHGGEERAPLPASMNAVRIMTIHKAKGLEAEVVIMPWHTFLIRPGNELTCAGADGLEVVAPLRKAMDEPYAGALLKTAREALHLVYVAWTRAVSELHCFLPEESANPMIQALNSLLAPLLGTARRAENGDYVFGDHAEGSPGTKPGPAALSAGGESPCPEKEALPGGDLPTAGAPPERSSPGLTEDPHEPWRPMAWLPRLRIFRTPLQDWLDDNPRSREAKRRGTLMHHCLERLRITGRTEASAREDAAQAVRHGLRTFPLPVQDAEAAEPDLTQALAWYAALPETARHLAFGTPERTLLDTEGHAHRVDLLVDDGTELVAVEYKTGTAGVLPNPAHSAQLRGYVELLRAASGRPAHGELIYLDRRERFVLNSEGGMVRMREADGMADARPSKAAP
ncbi:MAG: UvrD-helicase domain-containing protein [Desulfovibrionaceae bacterium]|nr:UvrD-helicase domain-containing protein [Desulfovibrionaceae bacterium]